MNALRKEHRLRVYGNKVLRRLSGHNREEMTVGWRKLHYEGIHSVFLPDVIRIIIKVNEVCKTCTICRREINAYGVLMRIPEGNRPLGRPVRRWEDNIKVDLQEIE
jgi:hypothetical protein